MSAGANVMAIEVNYDQAREDIKSFLGEFKTPESMLDDLNDDNMDADEPEKSGLKYMDLLQRVANRYEETIRIDLDDLRAWEKEANVNIDQPLAQRGHTLLENICNNTWHFHDIFCSIVDELMPQPTRDLGADADAVDILIHSRQQMHEREERARRERRENGMQNDDDMLDDTPAPRFAPELLRRYSLYFKPPTEALEGAPTTGKSFRVRDLKGAQIGHLLTVQGIVTRVSDVKPSVKINAYTCDKCGHEIFQEVKQKTFNPLVDCPSSVCEENQTKGKLFISTRASKFVPFQEARIQELTSQVPTGHIPRSVTIHINGSLVRSLGPGDQVSVAGVLLPAFYTGFRALRAGLLTETYVEAQDVRQHKQKDSGELDAASLRQIQQIRSEGNIYEHMARSIAPEIYGHEDVKKALLLLLIGGVTKELGDGMKIRGDLNVCLIGDPGVAKSQLLKYISKIAPRGVYTTGRGSSGVGLTAAVMRDPVTDEMVLEGGALVLADNGICCIDEFDKMPDSDRTAIHEVMEQQTISISKAGISTTLNARTSILAAANPLQSRYNPKLSPVENINLPAALLSRFDLLFLILDKPDRENDERLAEHVTHVHETGRHPQMEFEPLSPAAIRQFIEHTQSVRPTLSEELNQHIVNAYVNKRQVQKQEMGSKQQFSFVTPRTLLAIIRMSQALARLRLDSEVNAHDVEEALRLMDACRKSIDDPLDDTESRESISSKILAIVQDLQREMATQELDFDRVQQRVTGKGYTADQLTDAIEEYQNLYLWQLHDNGTKLVFL